MNHTVVADNLAGGVANDIGPAGAGSPALNADYSLIEASGARPIVGMHNIVGIDPLLGPLASNGGPTKTHALLSGSPAIDAGDLMAVAEVGGVPMFDQRGAGFSRVLGQIDIGAYETTLPSIVVDTWEDEDDGNLSAGDVSLREAIKIANGIAQRRRIEFAPALNGLTIAIKQALSSLKITNAMIIDARSLAGGLTIDGGDGPDTMPTTGDGLSLFVVDGGAGPTVNVEIIALTLTGGDTGMDGGAILNHDNLTVAQCTIVENAAAGSGGGIYNDETLTVTNCALMDNTAGLNGGGISNENMLTVDGCVVSTNAAHFGGGISNGAAVPGATATVTGSTVSANTSLFKGGGIYSYGNLFVVDSMISINVAGTEGGGICEIIHISPILRVTSSTVFMNLSGTDGGGILVDLVLPADPKPAVITNSTISSNKAKGNGGGVVVGGAPLTVEHSTITLNKADTDVNGGVGGGIGFGGFGGAVDQSNTIVAANISGAAVDDDVSGFGAATAFYCLIGINTAGIVVDPGPGMTSLIGGAVPINPMLGPLANNGGPTKTHALLASSPAINKGNPAAVAGLGGVPTFDQREAPFARVSGGRIDIGAFELAAIPGDYNLDGVVDAADYVLWRNDPASFGGAGGYAIWRSNFGATFGSGVSNAAALAAPVVLADQSLGAGVTVSLSTY